MSQNERLGFKDSMKVIGNYLMTGETDARFSLAKESEENAEIKNRLKKTRLYVMALICVMGIAMIIVFVEYFIMLSKDEFNALMLSVPLYIGMLVAVPIVLKIVKLNKGLKDKYNDDILIKAVQEVLPGAVCEPERSISAAQLYRNGVVPDFMESYGSYLINYNKNGHLCQFSNLSLEKSSVNNKCEKVFVGQAYVLNYKSDLQGGVRIMSTSQNSFDKEYLAGFKKRDKELEHKVDTENVIFNNNFEVYTTNEHSAFYVLTPYVMEQLLMMKRYYGRFGVYVSGNEIMIALNTNYFLFDMPRSYNEIEKMSVENSKQQLIQMLQLAQGIENSINGRIRN